MFAVESNGCLIGVCEWEYDPLYTPVVGLYVDNRLSRAAICDLPAQLKSVPGPPHRYWFNIPISVEHYDRLLGGDPAVRLLRLEDAAPIEFRGPHGSVRDAALHRVEHLLAQVARPSVRLDGFPKFLSAPLNHQIQIMFLDILGRRPDQAAHDAYLAMLRRGEGLMKFRSILISSDEFRSRAPTISDRIGCLITSPLWNRFFEAEPLGERRSRVDRLAMSSYADMSDRDFIVAAHRDCHGDEPTTEAADALEAAAQTDGRRSVIDALRRDAASGGRFVDLVD